MKSFKILHALSVFLFLLISSSLAAAGAKILYVAPHPDDDILTASGVVYRAVQKGDSVMVVYMTNGDYDGISAGTTRQGEAVNAQAYLGMPENNLIFLGYPDYYLNTIYTTYITSAQTFTTPNNNQSVTYASRGLGGVDYHYYKFGSHANYNSPNILQDLESIITDFKPDHIFTVGDFDQYADHYITYAFVKQAVQAVMTSNPTYIPTVHKTCVWCNSSSWPNSLDPTAYFSPISPSVLGSLNWNDRESLDVPIAMQSTKYMTNNKFLAISAHDSQKTNQGGFNWRFVHKDEFFWTENYSGSVLPPVPNAGLDQTVSEGATVTLDGSGSHDPNGHTLSYQWSQAVPGGIAVTLTNPNSANPTFTAPTSLKQDAVLQFDLIVNNGTFSSVRDAVTVIVHAANPDPYANLNVAQYAVATASTQDTQTGQLAAKAIDGVIDGSGSYPGDVTKEWATNGEKAGAWLLLDWGSVPYTVNKVILYDRPNSCDQILSATLLFSDGTTLPVGPLDNFGGATAYTLSIPVTTTSLKMTVNSVSSCTGNVGLAEIEVYGVPAGIQSTQTTISSSPPSPSTLGSPVSLTATVTAGAMGTVTFMDGASSLGIVTLPSGTSNNTATFTTSALTTGTHSLTAVYNGDAYHLKSTSNTLLYTVNQLLTTTTLVSSSPTSTYGSAVTFTATVISSTTGTPTGTVTFKDNGVAIPGASVTLANGTATFSTSTLAVGSHPITALYSGDTIFNASTSSVLPQTVNQAATTTSLASSTGGQPVTPGTSVTFTATLNQTAATGTVTFFDNGTALTSGTVPLTAGTAAFSTTALSAGAHNITATYSGDTNYATSTSTAVSQSVTNAPVTISVASSSPTSTYGTSVTFTATVTGNGVTPTGNVTFKDNGVAISGAVALANGTAAFSTSALTAATHPITAAYSGDAFYGNQASSPITQTVIGTTATAVSSSLPTSTYGAAVTFTATVTSTGGTAGGTVTFKDNGVVIPGAGAVTLANGTATFTTSTLAVGSHPITALYSGNANFSASTSSTLPQTVNQAATTTSLTSSTGGQPVTPGTSVTFTATLNPAAATGTVTFYDSATSSPSGTVPLTSGTAVFGTTSLTAGPHNIKAVYSGDTNYTTSTSTTVSQSVTNAPVTIGVVSSSPTSTYGTSVTFTATVTGNGVTPTGNVTFKDGSTDLGIGALSGGTATFSTSALTAASHSITAAYNGDTFYSGGQASSPITQTVFGTTATAVSSSLPTSTYGTAVTFTATVTSTGGTPAGTVTFKDNGVVIPGAGAVTLANGTATFNTSTLAVGSHPITALYSGNIIFNASTSSVLPQTVNQAATTTSLTSSTGGQPVTPGTSVTFTATLNQTAATGTVTFLDNGTPLTSGTVPLTAGTAVFGTTSLNAGMHNITAAYSGDTNYTTSTSTAVSQSVTNASVTVSVVSSSPTSSYGTSVTFTATVTGNGVIPTGTVTFKDGSTALGTGILSGGSTDTATFSISALTAAAHSITAVYGGDTFYSGGQASSPITQTVIGSTATAVSSSLPTSTYGTAVTFTATVTSTGGTPAGTVSFYDGITLLGAGTLNSGSPDQATFTTSTTAFSAGVHSSITAVFNTSTYFTTSTSLPITQTVIQAPTNVSITAPAVVLGAHGNVSVNVNSGILLPSGNVYLKVDTGASTPGALFSGVAQFDVGILPVGPHSLSATYAAQGNFGANSATGTLNVDAASSSTTVQSSLEPSVYGTSVTFTAKVTPSAATGSVTFMDGAKALGTGTLSGGSATYAASGLSGGAHSITAVYGGDTNYATSTSPAITQTVRSVSSSTAVSSSANPSAYDNSVTFTATVTGTGATGTVTFMDGSTTLGTGTLSGGSATYAASGLSGGPHSIAAVYGGDANFATSTSPAITQTVVMADGKLMGTGAVDITDALKALRIAAGIDTPTASDLAHGDVAPVVNGQCNPDGKIDLADVVAILRKAAGLQSW